MADASATVAGVELVWSALTDVGKVRAVNEDSILAAPPIFLVADGMGGHSAGDRASAAVVSAFVDAIEAHSLTSVDAVRSALIDADRRVVQVGQGTRRGSGSTVTGVAIVEHDGRPYWLVFNVGDSRVYRHAGGTLEQLTVDHSLAQELMDSRNLSAAEVATMVSRNVITRAIGTADATADSWLVPVTNGDRLLLCSDGLHQELADESMRAALTMAGLPSAATSALVKLALQAGGRDNVSVVVVDVQAGGIAPGHDAELTASAGPLWSVSLGDTTHEVKW